MQKIKRCDNISNHKMIVKRKDGQFKYTYKIARAFQNTRALNVLRELEFPTKSYAPYGKTKSSNHDHIV
jgi:hypothetical protein